MRIDVDALKHSIARDSFREFVVQTWPNYIPNRFHDLLTGKLQEFYQDMKAGKQPKMLLTVPPRHGKLLSDDTPVLTVDGWKNHGDLVIGDYVFGRDGNPVKVTHVHPKDLADIEIQFTNGEKIKCNEEHLWLIYQRNKHPKAGESVVTTKWLKDKALTSGKKQRCTYQIPVTSNAKFNPKPVMLDPYVLGVWLGDGRTSNPDICYSSDDSAVFNKVRAIVGAPSWTTVHKGTGVHYAGFKQIKESLDGYSLIGNKHIPTAYKYNSPDIQLALLAGLIDTDGHVDRRGRVRIVTSSERLKDDIFELCTILGFRPYVMQVDPEIANSYKNKLGIVSRKTCYTVGFNPDLPIPTVLPRKNTNKFHNVKRRVGIVSIKQIQPVPGNCITVEGGLYLVGASMILTHNSWIASQRFPLWVLGHNPSYEIMMASYSSKLAMKHSERTRALLKYDKHQGTYGKAAQIFPELRLDENKTAIDFWKTTKDGSYTALGLTGSATGSGSDCLIIDDPLKGYEEARSETIREKVIETYTSDLLTRLSPECAQLVILTRWHEGDLAGWLLENEPGEWHHINFPAIAEYDEYIEGKLWRREGEALQPERYPVERLEKIKNNPAPAMQRTWAALYQQRPAPMEGGIIKREWIQYYDEPPQGAPVFQSWDLAFSDKQENDYVAGLLFWKQNGKIYIMPDGVHAQMGFVDTLAAIRVKLAQYNHTYKIIIENKANGPAVIDAMRSTFPNIQAYEPGRSDKTARLESSARAIMEGKVLFPRSSDIGDKLLRELLTFPNAAHDDLVDALTQAILTELGDSSLRDLYAIL